MFYILYLLQDIFTFLSYRASVAQDGFPRNTFYILSWKEHRTYEERTRKVKARIRQEEKDLKAFNKKMQSLDEKELERYLIY